MGGGRTIVWDSFTDADNTAISQHVSNDGSVWSDLNSTSSPIVVSSRAQQPAFVSSSTMVKGRRRFSRNYEVSADIVRTAAGGNITTGIMARVRQGSINSSITGYQLRCNGTNWQLFATSFGVNQQLGGNVAVTLTIGVAKKIRLSVRGSCILGWVDDVLIFKVDDSNVMGPGKPGIRLANNLTSTPTVALDNFMVSR